MNNKHNTFLNDLDMHILLEQQTCFCIHILLLRIEGCLTAHVPSGVRDLSMCPQSTGKKFVFIINYLHKDLFEPQRYISELQQICNAQ